MKYLCFVIVISAFFCSSCGSGTESKGSDVEQVILAYTNVGSKSDAEIISVEFVQDITTIDSLQYYFTLGEDANNRTYDKLKSDILANKSLKEKAEKYLNYGGDGSKSYYQKQIDEYGGQMNRKIEELDAFVDASNGDYSGIDDYPWAYSFRIIERLQQLEPDSVLTRVYKAQVRWVQMNTDLDGGDAKTDVGYYFLDPSEQTVLRWDDDFEFAQAILTKSSWGPYDKYEGNKTMDDLIEESGFDIMKTEATYLSGEFTGACTIKFVTTDGEELKFINPDISVYESNSGCGIDDKHMKSTFMLSYMKDKVSYYIEDVGDIEEDGLVLIGIQRKI